MGSGRVRGAGRKGETHGIGTGDEDDSIGRSVKTASWQTPMRVVACQWEIAWEDKAANHARVHDLLAAAGLQRDSLVVLPEMFATGFSMNVVGITDSVSGETQHFLAESAARLEVNLLGGIVTGDLDGEGRNEAVLYSPRGHEAGRYRKIHPYPLAAEGEHFIGGDEVALLPCNEFVLAPFVCYDLRFPEVFRTAAARGATLFCVIASWPAARSDHWHTLLRARAIENQAYVVGVNRCGDDPAEHYSGGSVIFGPRGEVLARAGAEEGTIAADLDLDVLLAYRHAFPSLLDMRWRAL
jgi:omega-amidase